MKNELFSETIRIKEAKKSLRDTSRTASCSNAYSEWLNSFYSSIKLV